MLRWGAERLVNPRRPDPDPATFPRATPAFAAPRAQPGALTVTWVGHATVLIQLGGLNVLTDPVWGDRASPVNFAGPRRATAPGIAFATLPPLDVILLSHNHYDHLDAGTVGRLATAMPETPWCVPLGLADFVRGLGVNRVIELDWWDEHKVAGLIVTCAPAQHFSARTPWDRNTTLWCGFTLSEDKSNGRRVYFAGDTGYHPAFGEIGQRLGPFDLVLLPVGAYDPRWFMTPVHMNPEEAVRAYQDLSGTTRPAMVPIHWGTFKLTDEPLDEPPLRARAAWAAAGLPREKLWVLAHGETRTDGQKGQQGQP
jgi:N-acyl-phosphatidylethanolamine-hydrolysing phospholipase D